MRSGRMSARALYLAEGGLIAILKHAPTHNKVLLYQKDGKWTHTFVRAIAQTENGGVKIPTVDLDDGHVIEAWENIVMAFLRELGLSEEDARLVFLANRGIRS
jgi:hypothetical protein